MNNELCDIYISAISMCYSNGVMLLVQYFYADNYLEYLC